MGFLLGLVVHRADIQDRTGALLVLNEGLKEKYPRMKVVFADAGYAGACVQAVEARLGWKMEVVKKKQGQWQKKDQPPPEKKTGFEVLKWRWIVERTLAWIGRSRRLSKDYEQLEKSSETWILIAMSQLMLRRLA